MRRQTGRASSRQASSRKSRGTVRLWRRDDENHQEILEIIGKIWSLDPKQALQKATQPERQIWLWEDAGDQPFRGLVMVSTNAPALFGLENAFVSHAQRQLLLASRTNIFHVELIWARCGVCEPSDVVRRVLGEISQRLRAGDDEKMMVCPISDSDKNRSLGAALQALGFSVYGQQHVDFVLQLETEKAQGRFGNSAWELRNFTDPPDLDSLLACVQKIFPQSFADDSGRDDYGLTLLEQSLADENFAAQASYYLLVKGQVGGFVWLFGEQASPARLGLAAIIPELRHKGIAQQAFAQLAALWPEQGYQALHFSIAADNAAALTLARSIAAEQKTSRQTWLWTSTL